MVHIEYAAVKILKTVNILAWRFSCKLAVMVGMEDISHAGKKQNRVAGRAANFHLLPRIAGPAWTGGGRLRGRGLQHKIE